VGKKTDEKKKTEMSFIIIKLTNTFLFYILNQCLNNVLLCFKEVHLLWRVN